MPDHDNIQIAIDAGKGLATHVETINGLPVLISPTGATVMTSLMGEADARADKPRRRRGLATLQAIDSFCDHINRFKAAQSAVFADEAALKFIGVLNYHPEGASSDPAWGDHRALYQCPLSPEWVAWGAGNPIEADQEEFALFLDAHDRDLAGDATAPTGTPYPSPAELMTLAATLETHDNKSAKRVRDPKTGRVRLEFTEDRGVSGDTVIPPAFAIKIPVFRDAEPVIIEVRLRVDVEDGEATFHWQIHDSAKVMRVAFRGLVENVMQATELPVFIGTPEQ
jgi:uncharacterized protein YfdQ (DUF2303 family)